MCIFVEFLATHPSHQPVLRLLYSGYIVVLPVLLMITPGFCYSFIHFPEFSQPIIFHLSILFPTLKDRDKFPAPVIVIPGFLCIQIIHFPEFPQPLISHRPNFSSYIQQCLKSHISQSFFNL